LDLLFDQILKKVDALCSNKQKQASFPGKKRVCGDNLTTHFALVVAPVWIKKNT